MGNFFDDLEYNMGLHYDFVPSTAEELSENPGTPAKIDDNTISETSTYSSSKIEDKISAISGDVNTPVVDLTSDTGDTYAIEPNIMYRFGEKETLTITLIPGDTNVLNEYMFEFTSGSVATTLNVPLTVTWLKNPDIQTSSVYQVSIENNLGIIGEWSNE